jgi:16S rRNA (cytosine967-C5)-methyltransferase
VAYAALNEVFFRRRSLDDVLDPRGEIGQGFVALEPRDRAFVRLLISVVLKRGRLFDARLQEVLHEPLDQLAPAQLLTILRLGMAQLGVLKTPAHAVVDTCVDLAAAEGMVHHKSLVNAVMRRLVREGYETHDDLAAARTMLPAWLWQAWRDDYGEVTVGEMALSLLSDAPLDLTLRERTPENVAHWQERLGAVLLPNGSLRVHGGGLVSALPGFDEGAWWVQNAAAAIPATLLAADSQMTIVDLCAAPGGKTAQLAARGANVMAVDRSAPRLQRLHENLARLQLTAEVITADGASWQPPAPVDAVLLDAPCSATGTLRHQPDALWLKQPADQHKLAALQTRLLENAWRMLKPGGVVVYCTCSLQKAEGEAQIENFLARTPDAHRQPIVVDGLSEAVTSAGDLRILPHFWRADGGLDGFFVSRLKKQK